MAPATTFFLDAADMVALVRRVGLAPFMGGVADAIAQAFRRWEHFDKRARCAAHGTQGVIELMPVADRERYAFKYVNGHPGNTRRGLPTVMAFGVLADMDTGAPRLLAELTLLTAIRTAAMSALAARHLARPGSRSMALIGNGAQSEFQALAFRDLVGVRTLQVFDTDAAATDRLLAHLQGQGLTLRRAASAAAACQGADIATTATADTRHAAVLDADMLAPGTHVNAIGGDSPGKTELQPGVLADASVFVEFEPQTRVEGEIQQMPADFAVTEFWRVLAGAHPGRRSADERTVFDSVGFALEDLAALGHAATLAQRLGLGRPIDLVPSLADPKDLFGLLGAPTPAQAAKQGPRRNAQADIVAPA